MWKATKSTEKLPIHVTWKQKGQNKNVFEAKNIVKSKYKLYFWIQIFVFKSMKLVWWYFFLTCPWSIMQLICGSPSSFILRRSLNFCMLLDSTPWCQPLHYAQTSISQSHLCGLISNKIVGSHFHSLGWPLGQEPFVVPLTMMLYILWLHCQCTWWLLVAFTGGEKGPAATYGSYLCAYLFANEMRCLAFGECTSSRTIL